MREFSLPRLASFEIWIGLDGDGGFLGVGAENRFGNRGGNTYYNGIGTLPFNGSELRVTGTAGTSGSKTITFAAKGTKAGSWSNWASTTADVLFGTAVSCFDGTVTP